MVIVKMLAKKDTLRGAKPKRFEKGIKGINGMAKPRRSLKG
jgi:hypothetical protein